MTRSLSNSHAKRANRSAGARPLPDFYDESGLPKRRIPSELEPATFAHRVGIKGDHDDATLKSAQFAYNRMSLALDDIYKRERTILADSSQTPENHKLRVSKMLDKVFETPADAVEQARASLLANLEGIDREIAASFRSQMDHGDAKELRQIVRELPIENPHSPSSALISLS